MGSLPKFALALEGAWRMQVEGIAVESCIVDIENRTIAGHNAAYRVIGDLRLNDARMTAFLRIGGHNAPRAEDVILVVAGGYDVAQMILLGSHLLSPEHHVTVTLKRQPVTR